VKAACEIKPVSDAMARRSQLPLAVVSAIKGAGVKHRDFIPPGDLSARREHDRCCGTAADTSTCNDVMLECAALCGLSGAASGGAPQCAIAATAIVAADGAGLCCGSPCTPGGMGVDEGDMPMSLREWLQDYAINQASRKRCGGNAGALCRNARR
jgi:hypothetical protein